MVSLYYCYIPPALSLSLALILSFSEIKISLSVIGFRPTVPLVLSSSFYNSLSRSLPLSSTLSLLHAVYHYPSFTIPLSH